jgi:hypothetical protein
VIGRGLLLVIFDFADGERRRRRMIGAVEQDRQQIE